jgi:hypothetical protein
MRKGIGYGVDQIDGSFTRAVPPATRPAVTELFAEDDASPEEKRADCRDARKCASDH